MNRIALFTVLALAAIFFAFAAVAKEVGRATEGNMQARLFDEQGECPEGTVRVELWIDGKKGYDGCAIDHTDGRAIDHTDGRVYIVWSDGDRGILQRKLFKPSV
jgi:hypothetical protein